MGGHQFEAGAFAPGLPDCFGGLHTVFLCRLILGEDDAVPAFGVSADRHRPGGKAGVEHRLDRRVEAVAVTVQNHPVDDGRPLSDSFCLREGVFFIVLKTYVPVKASKMVSLFTFGLPGSKSALVTMR